MGWRKQRNEPLFMRTLKNWRKYRGFIKQYQGVREDLINKLINDTASLGFNRGVEIFETHVNYEHYKVQLNKEIQLQRLAEMPPITLEQMLEQKKSMEELAEKQKDYRWDPSWKPTVQEMLSSNYTIFHDDYVNESLFYRIWYVPDKIAYVGISMVPDCAPEIIVRESLVEVTNKLDVIFKTLKKRFDKPKTIEVKAEIDISHVRKAMGIDEQQPKINEGLNRALDDIF